MDEQTWQSMKRVVEYLRDGEAKHFEQQDEPDDHIFRDLMRLEEWLYRNIARNSQIWAGTNGKEAI